MRLALLCVGRLKAGPERELFQRYWQRLALSARGVGLTGVATVELDESRARRPEDRREAEAAALAAAMPAGGRLILLDERGASETSEAFAADIARARDAGAPAYALAIGGPDGFAPGLRDRADRVLSFGVMTWPHQLVRVMAAEQLYRAASILAGHPYHRR